MFRYARSGQPIFPLHGLRADGSCTCVGPGEQCRKNNPGKHPATPNGFKDATTKAEQIYKWLAEAGDSPRNIGMPVAEGCAVVDIDPRNGGTETFNALEAAHGQLPLTRVQKTGSGGAHIWVRLNSGTKLPGKLGPGVDIRNGGSSYVVVEPSSHSSGGAYRWVKADQEISRAPDWILAKAFTPEARELAEADLTAEPAFSSEQHDALAALLEPHCVDGSKHNLAKAIGGWLRQRGATLGDVRAVLERLPFSDPPGRVAGAVACYQAAQANGWSELCNLIGEAEARSLDAATPNLVYDPGVEWPEVWSAVTWPEPKPAGKLPELPPPDPGDPWFGLPRPMDPADADDKLEHIVEGLGIIPGAACGLIGKAYAAKTPTALALGLCVANGIEFLGRKVMPRRVIYLGWEKAKTTNRKRVRIARSLGVKPESIDLLNMRGIPINSPTVADRIAGVAAQQPALVIVDVYGSAVDGLDHNNVEIAAPLNALTDRLAAAGAALLVLFHCKKGDGRPSLQDLAGNTSLGGQLDAAIALHRENPDRATRLTFTCARAAEADFERFDVEWLDEPSPGDDLASAVLGDPAWGLAVRIVDPEERDPNDVRPVRLSPVEQETETAIGKISAALAGGNLPTRADGTVSRVILRQVSGAKPNTFDAAVRRMLQDGLLLKHNDGHELCYSLKQHNNEERI